MTNTALQNGQHPYLKAQTGVGLLPLGLSLMVSLLVQSYLISSRTWKKITTCTCLLRPPILFGGAEIICQKCTITFGTNVSVFASRQWSRLLTKNLTNLLKHLALSKKVFCENAFFQKTELSMVNSKTNASG